MGKLGSVGLGGALGGLTGAGAGLFEDMGNLIFGNNESTEETALDPATRRYIAEMRSRQDELWPLLQAMVKDQGVLDAGFEGSQEELQDIINSSRRSAGNVESFDLDPKALAFLGSLRDERINSIRGDLDDLFGSAVADLARRGVTSSSTAEGVLGRELPKVAAPMISQANQDYYDARLSLPSSIATTKAGLDANRAGMVGTKYNMASQRYSDKMNPLFQMWNLTAAPAGTAQGQQTTGEPATPGLLAGLVSGLGQGLGGSLGKGCWVAREVFGESNIRWVLFRDWLFKLAPEWFRDLYLAHGERFAQAIRNMPRVKHVIRRWMNARIKTLVTTTA